MSVTYTPTAADALYKSFAGQAFDDPIAYSAANRKRIDARFLLKPLQDEVLNLIAIALRGGGALSVRNESGSSLSAGPVRVSGYSAAHAAFKIVAADAAGAQGAQLLLLSALANNSDGVAYVGGALTGALNTSGSSEGAAVYLAAGGGLTLAAPTGADQIVQLVGRVKTVAASGDVAGLIQPPLALGSSWLQAQAVTYARIQNISATDKLLGRASAGAGSIEEIACTAAGRAILDDADAAAQRVTLGLSTLANLAGVTDASDAAAGKIGEQKLSSVQGQSSGGSGAYYNLASLSLTAGDWDVSGVLFCDNNGATITGSYGLALSACSGDTRTDHVLGDNVNIGLSDTLCPYTGFSVPSWRVNTNSSKTVYLKYIATYSAGTPKLNGRISARRVR